VRKLLVASQKAGVGKTTTSMNLAAATAMTGTRVLLLDADPLSNISMALNLAEHPDRQILRQSGIELPGVLVPNVIPGLDVLSPYEEGSCTDEEFERLLRALATAPVRRCYGCTIVDVPPFLGGSAAHLLASCDEYLVVMRAEEMAHRTFPAFLELVQRSSRDGHAPPMRGILLTLPKDEQSGCRLKRELRGRFGTRVLSEVIPHDERIGEALRSGSIGCQLFPDSPAAQQYHQLVAKLDLADATTPGIELEEIYQNLRAGSQLIGSTPNPVCAEPTLPKETPSPDVPLLPETAKLPLPGPRPRRLGRSGECPRLTRPDRGPSVPAASSPRRRALSGKGHVAGDGASPFISATSPTPHPNTVALAQLWPLWILLGTILGGGLHILPPSMLPGLIGLGSALLVVVVLYTLRGQKLTAALSRYLKRGWQGKFQTRKSAVPTEATEDALSARLTSLVTNSKRARRASDAN
jgi:chromosome partitioning protein